MSNVQTVLSAVKTAKQALGDLVIVATLVQVGPPIYQGGKYIPQEIRTDIEGYMDQFDFEEKQSEDFSESDIKFTYFSDLLSPDLPKTTDKVDLGFGVYGIKSIKPTRVGLYTPLISLTVRR